jgi:hypothetical protein
VGPRKCLCGFARSHGEHVSTKLSDFAVEKPFRRNPRRALPCCDEKTDGSCRDEDFYESLRGLVPGENVIVIDNEPSCVRPVGKVVGQIVSE